MPEPATDHPGFDAADSTSPTATPRTDPVQPDPDRTELCEPTCNLPGPHRPGQRQTTPSPAITYADPLYERLAKEQPGAVVLKSVIADLNRDGKKELAVALQPAGSKGATVAILPETGSMITLQQVDEASWVNKLVVLDHDSAYT